MSGVSRKEEQQSVLKNKRHPDMVLADFRTRPLRNLLSSLVLIVLFLYLQQSIYAQTSVRSVRLNTVDGLRYVPIPPGTFLMAAEGDNECAADEKPAHFGHAYERILDRPDGSAGWLPTSASPSRLDARCRRGNLPTAAGRT